MTYEVQYQDDRGEWRRWVHVTNLATAKSSKRRLLMTTSTIEARIISHA